MASARDQDMNTIEDRVAASRGLPIFVKAKHTSVSESPVHSVVYLLSGLPYAVKSMGYINLYSGGSYWFDEQENTAMEITSLPDSAREMRYAITPSAALGHWWKLIDEERSHSTIREGRWLDQLYKLYDASVGAVVTDEASEGTNERKEAESDSIFRRIARLPSGTGRERWRDELCNEIRDKYARIVGVDEESEGTNEHKKTGLDHILMAIDKLPSAMAKGRVYVGEDGETGIVWEDGGRRIEISAGVISRVEYLIWTDGGKHCTEDEWDIGRGEDIPDVLKEALERTLV